MLTQATSGARAPKAAFSDFDFVRIVIDFIGDLATSLNALLTFIQNVLNFGS